MVWKVLRKRPLPTSLSRSAKIIGIGKPTIRFSRLRVRVFLMMIGNQYELNSRVKFSKPIQGLPVMPLRMLKSLKAMMMPYMGL